MGFLSFHSLFAELSGLPNSCKAGKPVTLEVVLQLLKTFLGLKPMLGDRQGSLWLCTFPILHIHTKVSLLEVAQSASEDARSLCLREYESARHDHLWGSKFTFPYVPTHLHLMVFELVKNSLRVVQEKFMDSDKVSPPIES